MACNLSAEATQRAMVKQEGEGAPAPAGAAVPPALDQTAVKPEPEEPPEEIPEEVRTLSICCFGLTPLHLPCYWSVQQFEPPKLIET